MPIESKTSTGISKKTIGLVIGVIILVLAVLGVLAYNQRMVDQKAASAQSDNGNNMPAASNQMPTPESTSPTTINQPAEQAAPTIKTPTPATTATTTESKTPTNPNTATTPNNKTVEKPKTQTSTPTQPQNNDTKNTPAVNNNSTNSNTNPPVPPSQDLGAFDF